MPGNDDMQVYIDTVFGQYFPIVQARMAVGGKPVSDYWDQFAVLEYTRYIVKKIMEVNYDFKI